MGAVPQASPVLLERTVASPISVAVKTKRQLLLSRLKRLFAPAEKSQAVAALLAFFLGQYGVHRFYLGHTETAIYQLLLTVGAVALALLLTIYPTLATTQLIVLTVLVYIASYVWPLVDFILILVGRLKPAAGEYRKKS